MDETVAQDRAVSLKRRGHCRGGEFAGPRNQLRAFAGRHLDEQQGFDRRASPG